MKNIFKKIYRLLFGFYSVDNWWNIRNRLKNNKGTYYLNLLLYRKIMNHFGSDIPIDCYIENCPVFPHDLYGIFISKGSKIGKNCVIFQQVTIGSNTIKDSKRNGSPIIGDNCYIGCGAKIIGNVKIGNNVRVGANCVVVEDVEDNCTIVLSKSRVIKKSVNQNNSFVAIDDNK